MNPRKQLLIVSVMLTAALALVGCQTMKDIFTEAKTPVEKYWATLKVGKSFQAQAEYIVLQPSTPDPVAESLGAASAAFTETAKLGQRALDAYDTADARVRALQELGVSVPEVRLTEAATAGAALRDYVANDLQPTIDRFEVIIKNARKYIKGGF